MGDSSGRIYNIISVVFLLLTVGVLAWGISRFLGPPPTPVNVAVVPTEIMLPSLTPTQTPSATLPATWTLTPTNTPTSTPTETPLPTSTETPTITPTPTQTPTHTETPVVTLTPTVTLTSTQLPLPAATSAPAASETPAPSPYPFRLRNNQIILTTNFANTAGCDWQGIGGAAFDLSGVALNGIRVHVYNSQTVDLYTATGTNTLYGPGGWEMQVSTGISTQTYFVQLEAVDGTAVSPPVQVSFPGSCDGNLAMVVFEQTRPF